MNDDTPAVDCEHLVDDRPGQGIFRVHRSVYLDPRIFELELSRIFESTWVFIALASEVPAAHDFVTRHIGRQPVILMRDAHGELGCFFNTCTHRGTLLCPHARGNRPLHVCRYHGWSYDSAGRNVAVAAEADGRYPPAFATADHGLAAVPRLDAYRGFVFASLSTRVPPLNEHLGEARAMIDLVADQAPEGLEYVPGTADYTFDGNWKLQFENGLDAYHFPVTHASFVDIVRRRAPPPAAGAADDVAPQAGGIAAGTISFPYGHALSWSVGAPGQEPERGPLLRDHRLLRTVRRAAGDARLDWMLRQRNLTIFPNLQIIDIQSLQLRTWQPLAVDRTRMHSRCLAPVGENDTARRYRIRRYEEFFNAGGLATPDDNVMYELLQSGLAATAAGTTQGYERGFEARADVHAPPFDALGLQHAAVTCSDAGLSFGDETGIHSGYREWLRLMTADPGAPRG